MQHSNHTETARDAVFKVFCEQHLQDDWRAEYKEWQAAKKSQQRFYQQYEVNYADNNVVEPIIAAQDAVTQNQDPQEPQEPLQQVADFIALPENAPDA